jgi:hypothetical protein
MIIIAKTEKAERVRKKAGRISTLMTGACILVPVGVY